MERFADGLGFRGGCRTSIVRRRFVVTGAQQPRRATPNPPPRQHDQPGVERAATDPMEKVTRSAPRANLVHISMPHLLMWPRYRRFGRFATFYRRSDTPGGPRKVTNHRDRGNGTTETRAQAEEYAPRQTAPATLSRFSADGRPTSGPLASVGCWLLTTFAGLCDALRTKEGSRRRAEDACSRCGAGLARAFTRSKHDRLRRRITPTPIPAVRAARARVQRACETSAGWPTSSWLSERASNACRQLVEQK